MYCLKTEKGSLYELLYADDLVLMAEACHDIWLENLGVRSVEESILRRAEKRMLRIMCGVQLVDDVSTRELMVRLGSDNNIIEVVRQGSLRWLGHVVRKEDDDCVKQAWRFEVEGSRERGKPRLAWKSMMENLICGFGLGLEDAYDRVKWRERVRSWKSQ